MRLWKATGAASDTPHGQGTQGTDAGESKPHHAGKGGYAVLQEDGLLTTNLKLTKGSSLDKGAKL